MTEQFHIAEWYGKPFLELSEEERVKLAAHRVGKAMPKSEVDRLLALRNKKMGGSLTSAEEQRLDKLEEVLAIQKASQQPCPFRTDTAFATCTKPGGVCSIQLVSDAAGAVSALDDERGLLRALCPYRFHQGNTVFKHIGKRLLGDPSPAQAGEVGFLESTGNLDSQPGEDVGRIDMILIRSDRTDEQPVSWTAVEIQAVYFSGTNMGVEFNLLKSNGGKLAMPVGKRRPDYRSSGPKRLMPQLQIKVPTLRRWGKKMAIVVDVAFFKSMGEMKEVEFISNADIVWFLVDFRKQPSDSHYQLEVVEEFPTTLESAIEGLTGGEPVSLEEFEQRILGKA